MVADKTITHELKEGRLELTVGLEGIYLEASFKLASSNEMYSTVLSRDQIRNRFSGFFKRSHDLVDVISHGPVIVLDAVAHTVSAQFIFDPECGVRRWFRITMHRVTTPRPSVASERNNEEEAAADKTIIHDLKEGTLRLTIAAAANGPALRAALELKPSGEMFEAALSDTQTRSLCPLFIGTPQLIGAALKTPPQIGYATVPTTHVVIAHFSFTVLEAPFEFDIEMRNARLVACEPAVAELRHENEALRARLHTAETKLDAHDTYITALKKTCEAYSDMISLFAERMLRHESQDEEGFDRALACLPLITNFGRMGPLDAFTLTRSNDDRLLRKLVLDCGQAGRLMCDGKHILRSIISNWSGYPAAYHKACLIIDHLTSLDVELGGKSITALIDEAVVYWRPVGVRSERDMSYATRFTYADDLERLGRHVAAKMAAAATAK